MAADTHFVEFVEQHTDGLLTTAYLLTRNRPAAEELLQDVLVALYPQWSKVVRADSPLAASGTPTSTTAPGRTATVPAAR